ncbi:MAG: polysaccharide deacetylase family protein [Candidatus Binatia bacterium]|nr:polysaccharide deacetylase family protein [Candidatus Binatia bacterium]
MIRDNHLSQGISWPEGRCLAVSLTFDLQGGEDIKPLASGKINHEEYTQAEYGPNTGVWRILRVLERHEVKTTFLVCGTIAERYPDAVRAIVSKGHEVAGHGYHHEVARDLPKDEEREVIRKTGEMIQKTIGKPPTGWRSCTQSPNSLELLMEKGFLWNSNSFSFDLPFFWENGEQVLVELPRQPFGDGRLYGHRDSGNSNDTLGVWKSFFDELFEESKSSPKFCLFQFHPYISGRAGRAKALSDLIQHMKGHEGVWFATGSEVAQWWLDLRAAGGGVPKGKGKLARAS